METNMVGEKGRNLVNRKRGVFHRRLCRAMEKPLESVRQTSHEKRRGKCRGLSLKLKLLGIWLRGNYSTFLNSHFLSCKMEIDNVN